MPYLTPKLEFSPDPLSDTTPAWTDVTGALLSASWQSGVNREFDDPQAGQATFVLKNTHPGRSTFPNRQFEPEYSGGRFYPNVVPGRRFRWTLTDNATGTPYQQGIWYAQSYQVEYPAGTTYSTATIQCTDGFWRLALDRLGPLSPSSAQTYNDVIMADAPVAYYPMDELSGNALNAAVGTSGTYRGSVGHATPNPVAGDANPAAVFNQSLARAKMDDVNIFTDSQAFTIEVAADTTGGANAILTGGPIKASIGPNQIFSLQTNQAILFFNGGGSIAASHASPSAGVHHFAATFDGTVIIFYQDGVAVASAASAGGNLATPDAGEFLYIATGDGISGVQNPLILSHAAFYNYALSAGQIASHSNAALNLGYRAAASGTRIATLATDPLWSTAGIPAGTVTAAARMQNGQSALDEIVTTTKIEQPGSLFYFGDDGNPDYRGLQDTQTISATFGDTPAEAQYDSIQVTYNDELFNSSTVAGSGLDGATASNSQSISDYGTRAQDNTSLIITNNFDAALLAQATVDRFSTPAYRIDSVSLNGADPDARVQILQREVGDTIRVKRRGEGGAVNPDIVTRILAKSKSLDTNGDLRCTWTLARGFNATTNANHLGVVGYCELGSTFILA